MQIFLIAGVGGCIGTMLRYAINSVVYALFDAPLYPWGTLIINVLGCFLIGYFASLTESRTIVTPELRAFVQIGVLGGFTTYSTFSYETFSLIRDGQFVLGLSNVLLQVFMGLAAVWIGYYLAQ